MPSSSEVRRSEALRQLSVLDTRSRDLGGMLASLKAEARETKARRIVFDAIDAVLALLNDPSLVQREVDRLHEWLLARGFTAIITAKAGGYEANTANRPQLGFMQFMVDCSVTLNHEVVQGVSQHNLRVVNYRGSSFEENESPFVIGNTGLEVASKLRQATFDSEEALLEVRLKAAQLELEVKRAEKQATSRTAMNRKEELISGRNHLRGLRGMDAA